MKIKIMLPENHYYLQHLIGYIHVHKQIISITFISKDYISLQALCQILIDQSEFLRSSISRSLSYHIHSNLVYLKYNTSLLLVIFWRFEGLDILTSYDYSKIMIELNEFDCSKTWENSNANISISSMKIKIMLPGNYYYLQHLIVYIYIHK
jgi:hypothetical protein